MKTIVERLKEYLDYKGVSPSFAEMEIGVSNGTLSKPFNAKTTIKTNTLEKFLITYKDINPGWLLTGEGSMVKNESVFLEKELPPNDKEAELLQKQVALLEENKILLQEKIAYQTKLLVQFEREIEDFKKASKHPKFSDKPVKH